jgi:hypothetical protein
MAKITEEYTKDLSLNENVDEIDVLEDIRPEDYVFVIGPNGQLRGISLPSDDGQEASPELEDILNYIVEVSQKVSPRILH